MTVLLDDSGQSVCLGSPLGSGGEGTVYHVTSVGGSSPADDVRTYQSAGDLAAKIYHEPISSDRQEKLQCMVNGQSDQLKKLTAWPISMLFDKNGSVCGFLMNKAADANPVHHFYSPAQRKREHPETHWDFLVSTARNTAAAFHSIHGHGHVIGDVNPNLVFVSGDSRVRLIDCDSFQILGEDGYFFCEVGVSHFTPPELQENSSFSDIVRHANHDNFGLAVLLFHLLLMGRHPFSGVYSGRGDLPLETAILEFRYAYSTNADQKHIRPPPNSVGPSILSDNLRRYFEQAFSEAGAAPDGRPSAQDWVLALDTLKDQLLTCDKDARHKYFTPLAQCPWCFQEQHLNVFYFTTKDPVYDSDPFNLNRLWARIEAVPVPKPADPFHYPSVSVTPTELPPEAKFKQQMEVLKKILAAFLVLGSLLTKHPMIIAMSIATSMGLMAYRINTDGERRKRQYRLDAAKKEFSKLNARWQRETGDDEFKKKLKELKQIKSNLGELYRRIADQPGPAPDNSDTTNQNQQKQQELEKKLKDGPEQLIKINSSCLTKRRILSKALEKAALKVIQAEADMTLL